MMPNMRKQSQHVLRRGYLWEPHCDDISLPVSGYIPKSQVYVQSKLRLTIISLVVHYTGCVHGCLFIMVGCHLTWRA